MDWKTNRVAQHVREFEMFRGRRIVAWRGRQMALLECGINGKPQFEDARAPLLQLCIIHVTFDDDPIIAICTYQDDEWGLCSWITEEQLDDGLDGIFRTRELAELPCGVVSNVGLRLNERGNIADLTLTYEDGREVLLVAGEVYDDWGSLRFCRDDESFSCSRPRRTLGS